MPLAIVTGTSTGIGLATALKLATEGHTVRGTVRSAPSGQALLDAAAARGLDVDIVIMDVDDDASVAAAIGGVIERDGVPDVLVNNAGVAGGESIETTPVELFASTFNTNVLGNVRCVQAVVPAMRERGSGAIVNITSVAGRVATPHMGSYVASKFAQEALTECLAIELAEHGIRVCAIEPGVIMTPIFEKNLTDIDQSSPYARHATRMGTFFLTALGAGASPPEAVADVIWEAISTDEPKLRWPAGVDAAPMIDARTAETDEAYLAWMGGTDAAEWAEQMTATSGWKIRPTV